MSGRRCTVLALSLLCACGFVGVEPPEGSTFEDELSIVATGDFPFALATDDTYLYWSEFSQGSLHRIPLRGGESELLFEGDSAVEIYGIALGGGELYLCDSIGAELRAFRLSDRTMRVLAASPCTDVALDATHLYWTSESALEPSVRRMSRSGGPIEDLTPPGPSRNLVVGDEGDVYWTNYDEGRIESVSIGAGVGVIATVPATGPWGLQLDGDFVYWAHFHLTGGAVSRAPRAGGASIDIAASQEGAHSVFVDGDEVYWTNELGGTLMRRVGASESEVLVSELGRIQNLVGTDDALFFSSRGGQVYRYSRSR